MANAHKTAKTRKKPSAPMAYLESHGWLESSKTMLDFGCGKGFDASYFGMAAYDPFHRPERSALQPNTYDVITCNYVLNTITECEGEQALASIRDLLKDDGIAFIVVRRDIKVEGETSKGTFQRNVELPLNVVHETGKYCIYMMRKLDLCPWCGSEGHLLWGHVMSCEFAVRCARCGCQGPLLTYSHISDDEGDTLDEYVGMGLKDLDAFLTLESMKAWNYGIELTARAKHQEI